jgi:hypothetical protein
MYRVHGISLSTLYRKVHVGQVPTLLVVLDSAGKHAPVGGGGGEWPGDNSKVVSGATPWSLHSAVGVEGMRLVTQCEKAAWFPTAETCQ